MTGQTINLMTLGGLALAIGMLVDNATVVMENIHRNQTLGKPVTVAILDGSIEVIQPLTVATLVHLHRVLPGRVPGRPGALPVHPARHHRRAGDARVLRPVVHGGAGAGAPAAQGRASSRRGREARLGPADGERVRSRLRPLPRRLWEPAGGRAGPQEVRAGLFRRLLRGDGRAGPGRRHRLLPAGRRRHPQAACARAEGLPPRRHRADHDQGRGSDPRDHPGDGTAHRQPHHRRAGCAQPRLRAERQRQRRRRRDADLAEQAAPSVRALSHASSASGSSTISPASPSISRPPTS